MAKQTVLITGGSKGIGLATAAYCLDQGCRVVLLARSQHTLALSKQKFVDEGHDPSDIQIVPLDMADAERIIREVPKLAAIQDGLFGLVNNAAFEHIARALDFSFADMQTTWQVNMLAPMLMIRACYPYLKQAGGSIVNVSSIADTGYSEKYSIYGASKAFLNSFSKHAGKEFGFDGVRINIVSPGATDTPLMEEILKLHPPGEREKTQAMVPIEQRFGQPEEIAAAVWFALSGPKYLHGADIRVDGGI